MKKILFFAIIAFSMNAFAQVNQSFSNQFHPSVLKSNGKVSVKLSDNRMKVPAVNSVQHRLQVQVQPVSKSLVLVQIIDSAYHYGWNSIINNWQQTAEYKDFMTYNAKSKITRDLSTYSNVDTWYDSSQILYTYDANANLTKTLYQYPNGDVWINTYQTLRTYDAKNNEIDNLSQNWDGTAWANSAQNTKTYDVSNNITTESYKFWAKGVVSQGFQTNYTYDTKNNRTSYLYQDWDTISVAWVNSSRATDTYDGNNLITKEIGQDWKSGVWVDAYQVINISWSANGKNVLAYTWQIWNGTGWVDDSKNTSTVDAKGNQTSMTVQKWSSSSWGNTERNIYIYDANNNQTSDTFQKWDGSAWVNSERQLATFDSNNNQTSSISQSWKSSVWINKNSSSSKTYDANNFIVNEASKNWNTDGITVANGDSTHNYYHTVLAGLNNIQTGKNNISIYPNPSKGLFKISIPESSASSVEIFNLLGDKVYSNSNQPTSSEIDLSTAAKGVYLIKINNAGTINSKKILIQ
jgi:hypothetical protein